MKERPNSSKTAGLVEVDLLAFYQKAVEQWTNELSSLCSVATDTETSFEHSLKKRVAVQQALHSALKEIKNAKQSKIVCIFLILELIFRLIISDSGTMFQLLCV